jgi:hypothetical protein
MLLRQKAGADPFLHVLETSASTLTFGMGREGGIQADFPLEMEDCTITVAGGFTKPFNSFM